MVKKCKANRRLPWEHAHSEFWKEPPLNRSGWWPPYPFHGKLHPDQRWARMAFWLQYQDQESWNSLKISISISKFLKSQPQSQYQYQYFEMCKKIQNQNQFYWKGIRKFNIKINILEILKQSQHQNQDKNSWKIIIIQYQNQDSWELNQSKSRFQIKINKK